MKSVDALRKWADGLRGVWIDPNDHSIIVTTCDDMPPSMDCVSLREHANGILDEIDREFEDMVRSLTIDAIQATDENMASDGWVRLPVDADGVPIHVGDVMEWCDSGETLTVEGIGSDVLFYIDGENAEWTAARNKRHHHAPTVEDVLREFVERLDEIGSEDDCAGVDEQECRACIRRDIAAAYAEYAAKLRLAGDE